ncbi:UDP-N-acetylmuramoyl-L-alanine--D-glutamate ligase [Thermocrinis minervae]|uniref:UDP-N-acetylmuramoylalanine--D-glutamate ligase n=1 Tax=Thermocrinis minervae TaxID=381751 RepID=A0A1M6SJ73_9AQUI|nr:UDP-N-acetylmuramoyl-L-alanine--D-glutamate ligase [Thermocrinis minervae]SHK44696.1 UDP-N-acetylmuramoylalanine--D-glutamate ligase [Thermocrinis minervae]
MKFLVWGLGVSGRAAVELLRSKGFEVFAGDDKDGTDFREILPYVDTVVLSPGVPPSHPLWKEALRLGKEVIGELELAWRFFKGKAIAITGTDGKSTTTRLTYLMLKEAYANVEEGGNIGTPFSKIALENPNCLAVLEVSSFQGKTLKTFRPVGGAFLNFSEDHLDWHPDLEDYLRSKYNIFANQQEEDFLLLNGEQPAVRDTPTKARKIFFGNGFSARIERGRGVFEGVELFQVEKLKIPGKHNAYNALVASCIAYIMGVDLGVIKDILYSFKGLPYRLEYLGEIKGAKVYNDSKSTTPNSLRAALESFDNVILIAGGKDKGADFSSLKDLVKKKVKKAILIGQAKEKIASAWDSATQVELSRNLEEAFEKALSAAQRGDVILFSPGCASFDMFTDYKERGEVFKKIFQKYTVV